LIGIKKSAVYRRQLRGKRWNRTDAKMWPL